MTAHEFYFDTLAIHPMPLADESLTSYIFRLLEANGISSMDAAFALFFPALDIPSRTVHRIADYTPSNLDEICALTNCPQDRLLAATFYYLCAKFGCPNDTDAQRTFLSGSLSKGFRYCPMCLAEANYYRLEWRFNLLQGCLTHSCSLLEHCTYCGNTIPFYTNSPKVGVCPTCGEELATCDANPLSDEELQAVRTDRAELQFLLTPHESNLSGKFSLLGPVFNYFRSKLDLKLKDITRDTNIDRVKQNEIYKPVNDTMKIKFINCYRIARYLDISFQYISSAAWWHDFVSEVEKQIGSIQTLAEGAQSEQGLEHINVKFEGLLNQLLTQATDKTQQEILGNQLQKTLDHFGNKGLQDQFLTPLIVCRQANVSLASVALLPQLTDWLKSEIEKRNDKAKEQQLRSQLDNALKKN